MNSQNYKYASWEEEEEEIPNEFSGDEYENGGNDSENFGPRASISSRGT